MYLLIVVGGALAATAIAFKLSEVLSIFKNIKRLISDNPYSNTDIVKESLKKFTILEIDARRAINSKNPAAKTKEVIIYNY